MSNRINRTLSANLNRLNLGARSLELNSGASFDITTLRIRSVHPVPMEMVDPMRVGSVPTQVEYPRTPGKRHVSPTFRDPSTLRTPSDSSTASAPACSGTSAGSRVVLEAEALPTDRPVVIDDRRDRAGRPRGTASSLASGEWMGMPVLFAWQAPYRQQGQQPSEIATAAPARATRKSAVARRAATGG